MIFTYGQFMQLPSPYSKQSKQVFSLWGFLAIGVSALAYAILLYTIPRHEFFSFIGVYAVLFALYFWMLFPILQRNEQAFFSQDMHQLIRAVLFLGIGYRFMVSFALPPFSDDYFRFIWDGKLLAQGISPFLQLPRVYIEDPIMAQNLGLDEELFQGLNSPDYFSIYPPLLQAIFYISASLGGSNIYAAVLIMKGFVFVAECASLFFILRILKLLELPLAYLAFYALNPLVIVELCGNLHFEALMICFLLWAYYLLLNNKWWQSAIPFGLAVISKLLPIMLLPFLLRRIGLWKSIGYGSIVGAISLAAFFPILDLETYLNLRESVKLYFYSFEFNASIWYVVREIGYQVEGYNIIKQAGDYLSQFAALLILLYAAIETRAESKTLGQAILWAFVIYFAFASIVHPWYICTLVAFSSFTRLRFSLIWTVFLPLTYFTYRTEAYEENLFLVALEYIVLFIYIGFEIKRKRHIES